MNPETDTTKPPEEKADKGKPMPPNLGEWAETMAVGKQETKDRRKEKEAGIVYLFAKREHLHGHVGTLRAGHSYGVPKRWAEQILRDFPGVVEEVSLKEAQNREDARMNREQKARDKMMSGDNKMMRSPDNK